MKVVVVGSRTFDSLEYHLYDSFQHLGHDVIWLDSTDALAVSYKVSYWSARFIDTYDRILSKRLARVVAGLTPKLVVVVYRHLHPALVDEIKNRLSDVTIVQINPDALSNLEKQQIIASDFDFLFSKEPYIVDFLRSKASLNAHYLPEAFNPRIHQKPAIEKGAAEWLTNIDVLVFGTIYAYRARMIEQLIRAGIRVCMYGTKGPYLRPAVQSLFQKKYLVGLEKNRLLYGARIVFNNFHYAEVTSVNQKYFEINGIGGFQLSDYKPTVNKYTGVVADRVTFRTIDEAIDKIRYYLAHPIERQELAAQQYDHFQRYHTFDQRVDQLIRTIGLHESTEATSA